MFEKPLVTVIVPAYNTEKYIDKCLKSLLNQSYRRIEVIMIDDGSDDQTGDICRKYEMLDNRFRLIKKENTGVSDSRNIGIRSAKGKFLIFVDSDDYVTTDYIDTLIGETEKAQLVCAEYWLVKENQEYPHVSELTYNEQKMLSAEEAINALHRKEAFQGYLWNKIFLKEVIVKGNIYFNPRIKIWEDMLFCLKYLTQIEYVSYIGKPIYYYVQREDSVLNNNIWKENTQLIALDEMWEIVKFKKGIFHEYIKNYYANALVGLLGKENFQDRDVIANMLKMIKKLDAELSLKHRIKVIAFQGIEMWRKLLSR